MGQRSLLICKPRTICLAEKFGQARGTESVVLDLQRNHPALIGLPDMRRL